MFDGGAGASATTTEALVVPNPEMSQEKVEATPLRTLNVDDVMAFELPLSLIVWPVKIWVVDVPASSVSVTVAV